MRKMQEKNVEQKRWSRFLLIGLAFGILGFIAGAGSAMMNKMDLDPMRMLGIFIKQQASAFMIISVFLSAVMFGIELYYHTKIKRMAAVISPEEESLDIIERQISMAGNVLNIAPAIVMLFYGIAIWADKSAMENGAPISAFFMSALLLVLVLILATTKVYGMIFQIESEINPSKKAVNIYSMFSLGQLEKNSDEGEKRILYEGGFRAFHAMVIAATVLMIVSMVMPSEVTGVILLFYAVIVYLAGMIAFTKTTWKLEHGGGRK